jgi:type IV secretory pathway TrbD component
VVLLAIANEYGFHRDELYFVVAGRHPDWGYVDHPPPTPLASAAAVSLLGVEPQAVRVLPALATAAVIGLGHLDSTATYDVLAWSVIAWLFARLLAGADPTLRACRRSIPATTRSVIGDHPRTRGTSSCWSGGGTKSGWQGSSGRASGEPRSRTRPGSKTRSAAPASGSAVSYAFHGTPSGTTSRTSAEPLPLNVWYP